MLNDFKPTHDPNIDTFKVEYLIGGSAILAILFPYKWIPSEVFGPLVLEGEPGVRFGSSSRSQCWCERWYFLWTAVFVFPRGVDVILANMSSFGLMDLFWVVSR